MQRVEQLADRDEGYKPKDAIPFKSLIPLSEILSALLGYGVASKKIFSEYYKLIKNFDNELNILLNATKEDLIKATDEKIADAIIQIREGKAKIKPGYDGVYGQPIFDNARIKSSTNFVNKVEVKENKQEGLNKFL